MPKSWFLAGMSGGLGCSWARAALEDGDCVAVTDRDLGTIEGIPDTYGDRVFPTELDASDCDSNLFGALWVDGYGRPASHLGGIRLTRSICLPRSGSGIAKPTISNSATISGSASCSSIRIVSQRDLRIGCTANGATPVAGSAASSNVHRVFGCVYRPIEVRSPEAPIPPPARRVEVAGRVVGRFVPLNVR
jgi:hypothetical protein